jgi:hypothetical protein
VLNSRGLQEMDVRMNTLDRLTVQIGVGALGLWIALAVGLAITRVPWSSEAWFAIPAINLSQHGYMGTSVLASRGTWLRGLERHTYWIMPAHALAQAVWYKVIGFSLLRQRLLSVAFGIVALLSWFVIIASLSKTYLAALIGGLVIGFQRDFLNAAGNGRMDMMAAALGSMAMAIWLKFHSISPRAAVLVSHSLAAAAVFTHPCGVLFAGVLVISSLYAKPKVRLSTFALIAAPYLFAATLWWIYIAQAPSDFMSQFFGNASGFAGEYLPRKRFNGLTAPWAALASEVWLRYLVPFGFQTLKSRTSVLYALWLSVCVSALTVAVFNRNLRRQAGIRWLLRSGLFVFLIMGLFEGLKFQHYLVYSLPFLGALAAMVGTELWRTEALPRTILAVAVSILVLPQIADAVRQIRRDPRRTEYLPVADWLVRNLGPTDQVIAGAEFGYPLGFSGRLSDDVRLGYFTDLQPRYIVTSAWYRDWFQSAKLREPAVSAHIQCILTRDYVRALVSGEFIVYERKEQ